jgi:chromosome segregation ATPase
MAKEHSHPPESDLDKTDELPILKDVVFDLEFEDDAVPLDRTAVLQGPPLHAAAGAQDFARPSGVDLPSLAESVRSVEERISRQYAEYETLTRAYERARDAESASVARANALGLDLAAARAALESEQNRSRELDRAMADRAGAAEAARSRVEEALRESERYQSESRTLRDSLAARDAAIAQALHSLGERDAQLTALRAEHARIVPALEATSKSTSQLDTELKASRARASALTAELQTARETVAALTVQVRRGESEVNAARSELGAAKIQAGSYLELLQTREWRLGFDQNLFRDMDAEVGAVHAGHGALESERNRLRDHAANLEAQLATQSAAVEAERTRLTAELAARDRALAEARERGAGDARRVPELLEAAERRQAEHTTQMTQLRSEHAAQIAQLRGEHTTQMAQLRGEHTAQIAQLRGEQAAQMAQLDADLAGQIAQLKSEAETRDSELAVLMAHLQEARRPIQPIEADVKRLTEELAAKSAAHAALDEENRNLRATLERTRGALEEREFLIRRLERSESNNANVLGRIQTSIERLGSVPVGSSATATPAADWSAELIRIDGERPVTHVLSRRTRIGRATGCELQIDSGSVSRHHALVLVGPRESVIEDLNSTNGVLVNGRKVSRQVLCDGDAITIGETQFRYLARPLHGTPAEKPAEPAPTT